MWLVGLTGGLGSGKSEVSKRFAEKGVYVVDTDIIAHALTAPGGAAIEPLRQAFGPKAFLANGALDRTYMRNLIFRDTASKAQLEGIMHPLIRQEVHHQLNAHNTLAEYGMVVVPLLIETPGWKDLVNRVLVIDAPLHLCAKRVKVRSGLGDTTIARIMAAQTNRQTRCNQADDLLTNDTDDPHQLDVPVRILHQRYLQLAQSQPPGNAR